MMKVGIVVWIVLIGLIFVQSADIDCTTGKNTLVDVAVCYKQHFLCEACAETNAVNYPTANEIGELEQLVDDLLSNDGMCDSISLGGNLSPHLLRTTFIDTGNNLEYCLIIDKSDDNADLQFDRGFGMLAVPNNKNDINRHVHFSAPHIVADLHTPQQVFDLLVQTRGASALASGFHRLYAQGFRSNACQGAYGWADGAHNNRTAFHILAAQFFAQEPTSFFVQMHGMGADTCTVDAFISCGTVNAGVYDENTGACALHTELASKVPNVATPATNPCTLTATQNPYGRLINGVDATDVCNTAASSQNVNGRFMHVEQKKFLRETAGRPTWYVPFLTTFPTDCPENYTENPQTFLCQLDGASPSPSPKPSPVTSPTPSSSAETSSADRLSLWF